MMNVSRYISYAIVFASAAFQVAYAGPNQDAEITLDHDYRTVVMEASGKPVYAGDSCFVAVYASKIVGLNSYSVKFEYDSSIVQFCAANQKRNFTEKPFLESSGGRMLFISNNKSNVVEIAATLQGNSAPANGSGYFGFLIFKCLKNGSPAFNIIEAKLVDEKSVVDSIK